MDTAGIDDDPDLAALAGMRRRRTMGLVGGLVAIAIGLGAAWVWLRPSACDQLVRDLCAGQPVAGCRELADRFEQIGVTDDECEGATRAIQTAPPTMRDSVKVAAIMMLLREHMDPGVIDELERTARERAGAPPR
jgi:hypothetical protein